MNKILCIAVLIALSLIIACSNPVDPAPDSEAYDYITG